MDLPITKTIRDSALFEADYVWATLPLCRTWRIHSFPTCGVPRKKESGYEPDVVFNWGRRRASCASSSLFRSAD